MTCVEQLAGFVSRASFDQLSPKARDQLKNAVLDALGCALGALGAEAIRLIRAQVEEFGGASLCTLIGGGRTAPDRAAFCNGALVRYLDFNDSFLAVGESCHPSDNLAPVLAAAEYANCSGRELLTALAVAYQVQCRLSEMAPVRHKGFDHTTQGAYAVAGGVAKALGLTQVQTANAIAIAGTAFNALRVTRTGALSHWKGLAYPNTAFGAAHAAFLARRGITGPLEVFEGNKGFIETIAGPFELDWSKEDLERVTKIILKKYNAEVHSQSAIEALLELKREQPFGAPEVERVELETFAVAHNIIGGGEEGDKTLVQTKEQADHSLQYILAVAILDGQVMPEQYSQERIQRPDVQKLLRKISVRPSIELSRRFPNQMPVRLQVHLHGGRVLAREQDDYEGFHTRPMSWPTVVQKFERLSYSVSTAALRQELVEAVANLDRIPATDLTDLLAQVRIGSASTHEERREA
ncbi:MAG TPA: MmgE/PrpD family protein [Terriglobia bacterium]|nr:MmgE/PrpD family protein [Terriglobia bacterium]